MAKAKKMRVWVEAEGGDVYTSPKQPFWYGYWGRAYAAILCREDARSLFALPRGNTLYEYEVTAKLVKKIRPPKK